MAGKSKKKGVICTTLLVETSPQALPLGAACISSAINHYDWSSLETEHSCRICSQLHSFSLEQPLLQSARSVDAKAAAIASELISLIQAQETVDIEPFAICFSVFVWNRFILEKTAEIIKGQYPAVHMVAGGPEVTANPGSFTSFEYCIAGEGESAVPYLLEKIASGTDPEETVITAAAPDCNTLSSCYLDGTLDPDVYGGVLWELARGCPFKCSYCYESKGEKTVRYLPMERIEEEIDLFARKNVRQVFVLDPTYNARKDRAIQMLSLIRRKLPDTYFYFEARAEFIDRELAKAFSKVRCSLQFGLQSSDETVLANVHRTFNKKQFAKNIGYLNQTGVIFGFDLIYGLPGDTYEGFCRSIDFALSLYPNSLELFCLSVLPGTTLHDEAPDFQMIWEPQAPYHVIETPGFSKADMAKAAELARGTTLFYTSGRAVPWFAATLYLLKMQPSQFLERFTRWLKTSGNENLISEDCPPVSFTRILELQTAFVKTMLTERNKLQYADLCSDCIRLNGALSAFTAEGSESIVQLHYHPDDLLSEYATDLVFFFKNARKFPNRTKVFGNRGEADWKVIK